jgi:hypothetical protein
MCFNLITCKGGYNSQLSQIRIYYCSAVQTISSGLCAQKDYNDREKIDVNRIAIIFRPILIDYFIKSKIDYNRFKSIISVK